jgi:hypothetical protein
MKIFVTALSIYLSINNNTVKFGGSNKSKTYPIISRDCGNVGCIYTFSNPYRNYNQDTITVLFSQNVVYLWDAQRGMSLPYGYTEK